MKRSVYVANLIVTVVVLVGSIILYAVGQGDSSASRQLQAAGAYSSVVSLYALGALIGIIFFYRSKLRVRRGALIACRAVSVLFLLTAVLAIVPYLLPNGPEGVTLPAILLWWLFSIPVLVVALGFVYALSWAGVRDGVDGARGSADERGAEKPGEHGAGKKGDARPARRR